MRKMREIALVGGGILLALFVPVVPVWYAPVVPGPFQVYRLKLISTFQAIASAVCPLVGVSYRWGWYTPLVMLLTLAAGFALGRAVSKVFFARKH